MYDNAHHRNLAKADRLSMDAALRAWKKLAKYVEWADNGNPKGYWAPESMRHLLELTPKLSTLVTRFYEAYNHQLETGHQLIAYENSKK